MQEQQASWVPASRGFVPIGAAVGCTNINGPICIGRAIHNGFTLPGKVVPGKHCTLSWQGRAVIKPEYEVLCNAGEMWQIMNAGCPIPQSALPVGFTDHEGVLFAGRVHKQGGATIIGKVASKDSKCYVYINSERAEVGYTEFEILTVPPASYFLLVKPNNPGFQRPVYNAPQMPLPCNQNYPNILPNFHQPYPPTFVGMSSNGFNPNQNFGNRNFNQNNNHQNTGARRKNANNYQKKNKNYQKRDGFAAKKQGASKDDENQEGKYLKEEQPADKPRQETLQSSIECCHLGEIADLSLKCMDRSSECDKCDNIGGKNWECLSCRKVFCRGVEQHMMGHAVKTSHCVVISQEDLSVWCFKCDVAVTTQNINKVLHDRKKKDEIESPEPMDWEYVAKAASPSVAANNDCVPKSDQGIATGEAKEAIKVADTFSWLQKIFPWSQTASNMGVELGQEVGGVKVVPVPIVVPLPATNAINQAAAPKEKPCWVKSSDGKVPPGALSGCQNDLGEVYVARLEHHGALIPGKFVPTYNNCYASINGKKILKTEFEILCHVEAEWVQMTDALPGKAVQGGFNYEKMPLYIGRSKQPDNTVMMGKVEQIGGEFKLVFMLSRQEKQTSDFEILISHEHVPLNAKVTAPYKRNNAGRRASSFSAQESKNANLPRAAKNAPNRGHGGTEQIKWFKARDGLVPAGAVVGGKNHLGEVYVARAEHAGELIVGKLIPKFRTCYIAFQGTKEIRKKEYEVLCDTNTNWEPMTSGEAIPSSAIPAGVLGGKTLYIGRVCSGADRVTIGQVNDQGEMVALQNGNVLQFTIFDILVSTVHDASVLSRVAHKLTSYLASVTLNSTQPSATRQAAPQQQSQPPKKREDVFKLTPLPPTHKEYIYVSNKMQKTIKTHAGLFGGGNFTRYNISKIEKIFNTVLYHQYRHYCEKIKRENNGNANEKNLFHGSTKCQDIAKNGFDERHAKTTGMFGAGVYFAEHSSKSNQYTGGTGNMLMCKVALGKISEHTTAFNGLAHAPPGHHSVKGTPGGALNYPEYIVYRGEQALPSYLITYQTA